MLEIVQKERTLNPFTYWKRRKNCKILNEWLHERGREKKVEKIIFDSIKKSLIYGGKSEIDVQKLREELI